MDSDDGCNFLDDEVLCSALTSEWDLGELGIPPGFGEESELLPSEDEDDPPAPQQQLALPSSADSAPPPKKAKKGRKGKAKEKSKEVFTCEDCGRDYKSKKGLNKHGIVHKMEDLLIQGLPPHTTLRVKAEEFSREALSEWAARLPVIGFGPKLKEVAEEFLQEGDAKFKFFVQECSYQICNCMPYGNQSPRSARKDVPLPSEIVKEFLAGSHRFFLKDTFKDMVNNLFENRMIENDHKVIFATAFCRKLLTKLVAFIMKSLKSKIKFKRPTATGRSEKEEKYFRQCVHYIAGSVVRRLMRRARPLSRKYKKWAAVVDLLCLNFLKDDAHTGPHADLEAWTRSQDRGSLLYVSEQALNFFLYVGEVAKQNEAPDGSLDVDAITQLIHKNQEGIFRWDSAAGCESVRGIDSKFIMELAIKLFLSTWAKALIKKRRNDLHKAKYIPQAHRAKMAGSANASKRKIQDKNLAENEEFR